MPVFVLKDYFFTYVVEKRLFSLVRCLGRFIGERGLRFLISTYLIEFEKKMLPVVSEPLLGHYKKLETLHW